MAKTKFLTPNQRLDHLMQTYNINDTELAERLNVSKSLVNRMRIGSSKIPIRTALAIQSELGWSKDWIVAEHGPEALTSAITLDSREREIVEMYRRLNNRPEEQKAVINLFRIVIGGKVLK